MKSLKEEIDAILNTADLDYEGKFKALSKMLTKDEARMILGKNPSEIIRLKDELRTSSDIKDLRILYLVIERVYFDKIMSGEKKEEYRELKDTTKGRYTYIDPKDGKRYLKPFDAVNLCVGYHQERDTAIVALTDITCDGYIVTYHLGAVLTKKLHR